MKLTLLEKHPEATNITTFRWQAESPVKYVAGQFIQMILPHDNPDDRGNKRWFTLSSSPTDPFLSNTTKFAGQKSSSFKKALFALEPGDTVEINQPEGDFILPDNKSLQLVFIGGGIGVTPYHSMVKWLQDTGEKRRIKLVYGMQTQDELIFKDLWESYGVELKPYVGRRITTYSLMKEIGTPKDKHVYVSGPEPMVEALTDSLIAVGLPKDQLQSDYFPGYNNNYSR